MRKPQKSLKNTPKIDIKTNKTDEKQCNITKSTEYCQLKTDPNSQDYRLKTQQSCKSYFCPLCCNDEFSSGFPF